MERQTGKKILKTGNVLLWAGCAAEIISLALSGTIPDEARSNTATTGLALAGTGIATMIVPILDDNNPLIKFIDNASSFIKNDIPQWPRRFMDYTKQFDRDLY